MISIKIPILGAEVRSTVYDWLRDNLEADAWFIRANVIWFRRDPDAVMFKLTWGDAFADAVASCAKRNEFDYQGWF